MENTKRRLVISGSICIVIIFAVAIFCIWHQSDARGQGTQQEDLGISEAECDEKLTALGVPADEIKSFDYEVKAYILESLDTYTNGDNADIQYINGEELYTLGTNDNDSTKYATIAFSSGELYYIYITFEPDGKSKPTRDASLMVAFGDAFWPLDYVGRLWAVKSSGLSKAGELVANWLTLSGGEYSGPQLGADYRGKKFKGCILITTKLGEGSNKDIDIIYSGRAN